VALGLLLLVASCATPPEDRYLTLAEDQQLRETCEPHGGCVAVPLPLMDRIMKALRGQRDARRHFQ
jgi:hypothetical protein